MPLWLIVMGKTLGLMAVAYGFGVLVDLGERLRRGEQRWFPRAPLVVGAAAGATGLVMLHLGHAPLQLLWLATLGAWLLRGRLFALGPALMAGLMLGYVFWLGPRAAYYPWEVVYFATARALLGVAPDGLRALGLTMPKAVAWLLGRRRLGWYLLAAGYCALFELDSELVLGVYGFAKGEALLESEALRERLRTWGLRSGS